MAILLLTATITPPSGAVRLARVDPAERLADYREALAFYLRKLDQGAFRGIVLAENSASDLTALRDIAGDRVAEGSVEFLSFFGLDYPDGNGRAFGEMRLIERAMCESRLIASASPEEMIWKVTGRYVVRNIERLLSIPSGIDICCHCRNFPMRWADMFLMGWRKGVYGSTLAHAAERVKEGDSNESAEVKFRCLVDRWAQSMHVSRRFAEPPLIVGVRGFDNARYHQQRLKELLRRTVSRVAPWIWI